jgi:hypothetical protein
MASLLAKVIFAGTSIIFPCDVLLTSSSENHILVAQCALLVYAKFKQSPRPSKLRSLASMEASSIQK